ncbi:sigma-70 family RNA polymerase sigma factor [Chitinophaga sp. CC14]|uniref:RNA polymerase sigma factor n=1 Tax=Chitinophaga sp. CC14 TaxID=3029199 RepID=UPI003B7FAEAC
MSAFNPPYHSSSISFRQVYITHYDSVYSCAYFYLKQHEKSEDLTQSIFLHLWENWETFKIENLKSYLFITTRNAVFNELRKLSVQEKYRTYIKERFNESSGNIEEMAIMRQQSQLLEKAVQRLPARQQQAWRLSKDKGLTYNEVATRMGISKPTVKELIAKSIRSIKSFLETFKLF